MPTIHFKVTIRCGNKLIPITKRSRIQPRIIKWYNDQFTFLSEFYKIKITTLSFDYETGLFVLKYNLSNKFEKEPHLEEMLADPDDDGNYPINAYGSECLVIGEVVNP